MYKALMMNPTLEDTKTQCNSMVFKFPKREKVEVPKELAPLIYNQLKKKGIYIVPENEEEAKKAHWEGLRSYLNGTIKTRIQNFLHEQDEFKKKGVTLVPSPEFDRALRWQEELSRLLNIKAPIEEELSYLDSEEQKIEEKIDERMADKENRRGRKRDIESFAEVVA